MSAKDEDDVRVRVKRVQKEVARYIAAGGRLLSEELIAERRKEARPEEVGHNVPMPAKLPAHLKNPPRRELKDLAIGETGYVWRASMGVGPTGGCYLDPTADLTERGAGVIQVDRREDGFHVTVVAPECGGLSSQLRRQKASPLQASWKTTIRHWPTPWTNCAISTGYSGMNLDSR